MAEPMGTDERYRAAIFAYKLGDYLGSPLETGSVCYQQVDPIQLLHKVNGKCTPTDETDLVLRFHEFIHQYGYLHDQTDFLLSWSKFITEHHGVARYGRTYPDFFNLINHLNKNDSLNLETIQTISQDRNSFGNGCLALVYPLFQYLFQQGFSFDKVLMLSVQFARLTHSHPLAVGAVSLLVCIIDLLRKAPESFFDGASYERYFDMTDGIRTVQKPFLTLLDEELDLLPPLEFVKKHPTNIPASETLFHALFNVNKSEDQLSLFGNVASIGGDVDSVLSLAMMLKSLSSASLQALNLESLL